MFLYSEYQPAAQIHFLISGLASARVGASERRLCRLVRPLAVSSGWGRAPARLSCRFERCLSIFFKVVGHGREPHGCVSPGQAAHIEPAQTVARQQILADGLNRALAHGPRH